MTTLKKTEIPLKVAVVHDWLVAYGGAERALEQILKCYPNADLYCVINFLESENNHFLKTHSVTTSFLQKVPFVKKIYRKSWGYLSFNTVFKICC